MSADPTVDPPPNADGGPGTSGSTRKLRVFVTSKQYGSDLRGSPTEGTGLSGADDHCATAAAEAKLGGSWLAFVAPTDNPSDKYDKYASAVARLGDATSLERSEWYLVDDVTLVFKGDLLTSTPHAGIDRDELGGHVKVDQPVWTGFAVGCGTCTVWTNNEVDGNAKYSGAGYGVVGSITSAWAQAPACQPCVESAHLYCFER
jgi:hypothetical protein